MAKLKLKIKDLRQYVGQEIGLSNWQQVTQSQVNDFAAAIGDQGWVHLDEVRAKTELPEGRTIVHNFLLLSLIPSYFSRIVSFEGIKYGLNRGANCVKFHHPLPTGSEIRLRLSLLRLEYVDQRGMTATFNVILERKGHQEAVVSAELILLFVTE